MNKIRDLLASLISVDKYERLKVILLSLTFLLVIGAYTVIYDLKNSIFMSVVGKEYVPWAKMLSMIVLIPAVVFYAFLVDRLRRHQLLYFYSTIYAIFGILCAYLIGHPTIGLPNTDSSPWRLFGWFFYFFVEGFAPFMVSVFWAFSNSITSPQEAKDNYGVLVAGSKIGGMLSAGLAWALLQITDGNGARFFSDELNHQILLLFFSALVLSVSSIVYIFIKKIPSTYFHGYEAVYQFEKTKQVERERPGLFSGLLMLIQRPYILGIFGMLFFYEVLNTILSYQRLSVAQLVSANVSDISAELYKQMFAMHFIGFFISIIGTRTLLRRLGEPLCLLLIPLSSGILLLYFWISYTPFSLLLAFVALKSVNYAFASPVRESLYIPTVKDVKFKSKSWVDAFGGKIARTVGSSINKITDWLGPIYFSLHGGIFCFIIGAWLLTAFLLGRRYAKAIEKNEVIG